MFAPETAWLTQSYGSGNPFGGGDTGENPQYGATVFFNLPPGYNGKTPATLSFLDANGATVRSFTLHPKAQKEAPMDLETLFSLDAASQRAHDLKDLTGVKAGSNSFLWDMKYAPAYDFPGFHLVPTDDWQDSADGATVVPGAYTAVLQYGDTKLSAPITVKLDPRVHPGAGDLEARLALEQQIVSTIDSLDRQIGAALAARAKMPAAQRAAVDAAIADLVQLDIHSSEADVLHETKLREQLAFLLNSLEGAYAKPTAAENAAYNDLKTLATQGEEKLKAAVGP